MKEKMPKKSGRWWFWRKSSVKQVLTQPKFTLCVCVESVEVILFVGVCIANDSRQMRAGASLNHHISVLHYYVKTLKVRKSLYVVSLDLFCS